MLFDYDDALKINLDPSGETRFYECRIKERWALAGVWESIEFAKYVHKEKVEVYSLTITPGETMKPYAEIEEMIESVRTEMEQPEMADDFAAALKTVRE
tara:strand:+ start:2785 stop:3081 length:297 start_codon:yes stop_codon:yes gene_type:complete